MVGAALLAVGENLARQLEHVSVVVAFVAAGFYSWTSLRMYRARDDISRVAGMLIATVIIGMLAVLRVAIVYRLFNPEQVREWQVPLAVSAYALWIYMAVVIWREVSDRLGRRDLERDLIGEARERLHERRATRTGDTSKAEGDEPAPTRVERPH